MARESALQLIDKPPFGRGRVIRPFSFWYVHAMQGREG